MTVARQHITALVKEVPQMPQKNNHIPLYIYSTPGAQIIEGVYIKKLGHLGH